MNKKFIVPYLIFLAIVEPQPLCMNYHEIYYGSLVGVGRPFMIE